MKRTQTAILVLFLVAGGNAGAAFAEGTQPSTAAAPAPMSAAQQQAAAQAVISQGTTLSQRVGHMLDEARREGDVIRANCLNDKLTEINAALRTAQDRVTKLGKATDADSRNYESTLLGLLGRMLQTLDQLVNQCVGEDLYEFGTTKVVTEIDTDLLPFVDDPGTPPTMLSFGGVIAAPIIPPSAVPPASGDR